MIRAFGHRDGEMFVLSRIASLPARPATRAFGHRVEGEGVERRGSPRIRAGAVGTPMTQKAALKNDRF